LNLTIMAKTDKINLTDLHVNTDNYRFEPVSGQKEAIDKMVSDQGDKLFYLAEHIVTNGLNPNDKIQVTVSNHDKTKFNVLEGNRRVVALKLLSNPDILDGHAALKKRFSKLHAENKSKILKSVECTIYDDPKEADIWIGIKHGYGKTGTMTDGWTPYQKERYEEKMEGKSSIILQTIKLLQTSPEVPAVLKSNLGNLKVTNLDRLISDPDVRDFLGMEINNGVIQSLIEQKEVVKGLTQIAQDLLKPNFKVSEIYNKDDRKDYINKFPKESIPNKKVKAKKPWQFNDSSSPAPTPQPKPKPNPKDRDKLIPKSCSLRINNPKVNALYHELQKLSVNNFTNVAAIGFRSFVEFSMDCYIEANKITLGKDCKTKIDKYSSFSTKVTEVANHLEANNFADSHICKGIRSAVNQKNDLLGIDTLHAYVHNAVFAPIPKSIIITWDNIQPFIEKAWANIK
jgi:hypothetical protein